MIYYRLGEVIRELRSRLHMTQEELAAGICSVSTIAKIESGSQMTSGRVADALLRRLKDAGCFFTGFSQPRELEELCSWERTLERAKGKQVFLIGGGIGIPPMVQLAKELDDKAVAIMGYRNADTFLDRELSEHATLYVATEDGSLGTKGNVIDCIRENDLKADVLFACGPTPMLRALKAYAKEAGIECWISMEERMACGIGACLACVCKSTEVDAHSQVKNKRVCKEGPVFLADDVEL